MGDDIPQWAKERACELSNREGAFFTATADNIASTMSGEAFARYIAEHEEAPVDPLLVEAREIAASFYGQVPNDSAGAIILSGKRDEGPDVQVALAALRRGMELATPDA